jgi:hypothetical protein
MMPTCTDALGENARHWKTLAAIRSPASRNARDEGTTKKATRPSPSSSRLTIRGRSLRSMVERVGSSAAATLMPNSEMGSR